MNVAASVWHAGLVVALLLALTRGGREERTAASVLAVAALAAALHSLTPRSHLDGASVALDLSLLAYLGWRAMATTRWWPLYACAAQCAVCLGLLAYRVQLRPLILAYHTNGVLWSYAILLSLAAGTLLEQARVREEREVCPGEIEIARVDAPSSDPRG